MSHHLVETIDLCFSYPDSPPALNGVSLRITHGESVAVVGGNGAGKSTLLLHLNGLLPPSSGQVRVGDIPVTPKTVARVRESVGMVFQQAEDQLFMPTVREDVAFGPLNMGLPPGGNPPPRGTGPAGSPCGSPGRQNDPPSFWRGKTGRLHRHGPLHESGHPGAGRTER